MVAVALSATGFAACGDSESTEDQQAATASEALAGRPNALGAPGTGAGVIAKFGEPAAPSDRADIEAVVLKTNTAIASGKISTPPLTGRHTVKTLRELKKGKVTDVRVKGDNALVVFVSPGPRWTTMPVQRKNGTWKLGHYGKWSAGNFAATPVRE